MKIALGVCHSCGSPIFPESDFRGYYCTGCLEHFDILFDVGNHFEGVRVFLDGCESAGVESQGDGENETQEEELT